MFEYPTTIFLHRSTRLVLFWTLLAATVLMLWRLNRNEGVFAGRPVNVALRELVAAPPPLHAGAEQWSTAHVRLAQHWLTLDSLFALIYAGFLSVLAGLASQWWRPGWWGRVGATLSWLVLTNVAIDWGENAALAGLVSAPHNALARTMASTLGLVKWVLPGLCAAYGLSSLTARLLKFRTGSV